MDTKQIAAAAAGLHAAYIAQGQAESAEVKAVGAILRSFPLGDADAVKALGVSLKETFGTAHADAYQIRWNIIRNAQRVAHGGTAKSGRAIKGDMAAMVKVLDGAGSIRELKPAMAEAVPKALKGKAGGERTSGKKSGRKASGIRIGKVADREQAFAACRKVLEIAAKFLTKARGDAPIRKAIEACAEAMGE